MTDRCSPLWHRTNLPLLVPFRKAHYDHRVTPRELLDINGDLGSTSPLVTTARRVHAECERLGLEYCIVGGLAVIRNGATRTTMDVDVLISRSDWARLADGRNLRMEGDRATDAETGIDIDALFPGNEWGMAIDLPEPSVIAEFDAELGARFASLPAILEIKTAVYRQKRDDDGDAIASKDLSDLVSLIQRHGVEKIRGLAETMHSVLRGELLQIVDQVDR